MKNDVKILAGGLMITISLQGAAEASVNDAVEAQVIEIQEALAQTQANQEIFDEHFVRVGEDAFFVVDRDLLIDKESLIYEIQKALEEENNAGNDQGVQSLLKMLEFVENENNTFSQTYRANVKNTSADEEADLKALRDIISTLSSELTKIQADIAAVPTGEERSDGVLAQLDKGFLEQMERSVKNKVKDGMQARVFMVRNGAYYIDAGQYAGVRTGTQYAVADQMTDDYIGNMKIIYCMPSFSIAVPSHSTELPVGAAVVGLMTKKAPEGKRG